MSASCLAQSAGLLVYYIALRYLGLLPEGEYNKETLDLYAGVVDQTKVLQNILLESSVALFVIVRHTGQRNPFLIYTWPMPKSLFLRIANKRIKSSQHNSRNIKMQQLSFDRVCSATHFLDISCLRYFQ